MKYKQIPTLSTLNKGVHPRLLQDNQASEASNVIFEDGKIKTRWGYDDLGSNLPLDGVVVNLHEYKKLRTEGSDLLAVTANNLYKKNDDVWDEFYSLYNTGTVSNVLDENLFAEDTYYHAMDKFSLTKFVIVYSLGVGNEGKVRIGEFTSTGMSFGTEYTFSANATYNIAVKVIDDSHFIIAYNNSSHEGLAVICKILGDEVIEAGTHVEFSSSTYSYIDIDVFDSTRFIIAYQDYSTKYGKARMGSMSGTEITGYGGVQNFSSCDTLHISISIFDSVYFVISYVDDEESISYYGTAIIGMTSGTQISSFGDAVTFSSSATEINDTIVRTLDATSFIVAWEGISVMIGTIDGTEITLGDEEEISSGNDLKEFDVFDSTHFFIGRGGYGWFGTIDGSSIELSPARDFSTISSTAGRRPTVCIDENVALFCTRQTTTDDGYCSIAFNGTLIEVSDGTWDYSWPKSIYSIKFETTEVDGVGTPDVWYDIHQFYSNEIALVLGEINKTDVVYIIRQPFMTTENYFSVTNVIEGLTGTDEKWSILTNGIDFVKKYTDAGVLGNLGGSPPLAKFCVGYYGHLLLGWVVDSGNNLPQSVYWSDRGDPEEWLAGSAGYIDLLQGDDWITGMEVFKQRLFVFKEKSIVEGRYTGYTSPAFDFIEDRIKDIGVPNGRTIVNIGETIFFKSLNDIYAFNGMQVTPIGAPVIKYILELENAASSAKSFATHIPTKYLYCLFVVTGTNEYPDTAFIYNYINRSWSIWEMGNQMTSSTWFDDKMIWGDKDGYVYEMDFTDTDDNGTDIDASFETKDYPLNDYKQAVKLLETVMTTETNSGQIEISLSVDFGNNWSSAIAVNQNTTDNIYEHVQNWLQRGEQVRFKIENISGSKFAFESLMIGFRDAGITLRR